MNTTNHTPGPWKHDENWGLIKHGKTEICALHSGNGANAHLIASAPDLLSALIALEKASREVLDTSATHDGLENCKTLLMARVAIEKARGEA